MGLLRDIQLGLERYYDLDPFMNVEECRLLKVDGVDYNREYLMVKTLGDCVELGLFIDPELEERAALFHAIDGGGLDAWAALVEGVSHFLYVGHCGRYDRRVSLNELEYQAEADKFLFTAHRFMNPMRPLVRQLETLYRRLFEGWTYVDSPGGDHGLYLDASRRAAQTCTRWIHTIRRDRWSKDRLRREGRRFYRKNFDAKSQAHRQKWLPL